MVLLYSLIVTTSALSVTILGVDFDFTADVLLSGEVSLVSIVDWTLLVVLNGDTLEIGVIIDIVDVTELDKTILVDVWGLLASRVDKRGDVSKPVYNII